MAFSYGVQGYGVPEEEPAPPNPFLGGGWDDSETPPMLPQGEAFRSSGVSPDAQDPFASTATAGSYAPAPQYDWSPTGPINYAPDPGAGMTAAAPPADPMAQVPQTAFDRVFSGGQVGGEPFSAPVDRPGPKGAAIDPATGLSEALRLNREQGQTDITQAQMGADLMKRKSDFDTNTLIEQDQLRAKYQTNLEMARQVSEQKIEAYKNLKPDSLFGSSRGGNRETTLALMVLGGINDIIGNRQGQASSAMQALQIGMKQLETDDSIRFGKALNEAKGAQRDQQTLEAQRDVGLAEIAHRNAARWKVVEDGVRAELAQMAPGEARVKAEQNALVIQQKSAAESQRAQSTALELAEKGMKLELAQRKARGGGGAGGPAMKAATAGEISGLQRAEQDIKAIDSLENLIQTNPEAWEEFRSNRESWKRSEEASKSGFTGAIRRGAQGIGLADISEDQGLRSEAARAISKGMNKLGTSIAKGYGGAITSYDTANAANEMGQLSANPQEMLDWLSQQKGALTSGRDLVLSNRRVNMPNSSTAVPVTPGNGRPRGIQPAPGAPMGLGNAMRAGGNMQPSAPPPPRPGARLQRNPTTGAYRYLFEDGHAEPAQ